jgi:RimJ/RimL family protein N-acetyltransferase
MPELRFPDPPLTDDAVRLRPWTVDDIGPAHRATQDPLIPRFTRVPADQTQDDVRLFLATQEPARAGGRALGLVIADAGTGELLGSVGLLGFDWDERRCEVGYWLASWARGRGAATSAVRLLAPWGLRELGLARVALHTTPDNEPSQRVAERAGFTREGVLRSFEERDGRRLDVVVFSLLPADLD